MSSKLGDRPALVSVCGTFLPKEALHIHRQVCAVESFDHWVVTRRRENAGLFPFEKLVTLKKSPFRGLSRLVYRMRGQRVPFSGRETRQLLRLTREKRAAVVHIYLGNVAARAVSYLSREQATRVVSFHGGDLSDDVTAADFRALCSYTDLFLVRSRSLADALEERGCPPERIRLNRTGVPIPSHFTGKTAPPGDRPVRILQACRFIAKKGLDVTLRAVHRLAETGRDVILGLAGGGPEEDRLRCMAGELGLADRVRFLGFLDNPTLLEVLPEYDVFVHPSRTTSSGDREGIPNSILEAMANGLPVVATRHSGIPEAITDRKDGLLIGEADAAALAGAIERLLDFPQLYANISRSAHKTVAARFSIPACARALEASYWEAMEPRQVEMPARLRVRRAA